MDKKNGGMETYLTSEESPNLTESQFNEDIGYKSTQRYDHQSQFNEDTTGYTSTQGYGLRRQFNEDTTGYTSTPRYDQQSQFNEDTTGYTSTPRYDHQSQFNEDTTGYTSTPWYDHQSQFNEDNGYTSTPRYDYQSQFNEDTTGYTSTPRYYHQSQFNKDNGYTSTPRYDHQSQFNEDTSYSSTQRYDLQSQFNEDTSYSSTQRYDFQSQSPIKTSYEDIQMVRNDLAMELRPAAIHTCLKMNKKLNTYSRSGSIADIFNAPTHEFVPPDDDNEVEIINEVKSIKKHSNVFTPNFAPPPPLQTTTISEVEINKSKYIEDVTTTPISGLTSLNKVEIIENQPGNRKDNLTQRHETELPQKVQNESIHLDVSDSSEYEHQHLYVTSTTPPNSSSMHLSESEHQTCSNTDVIKRRTKSRTNRRHSDSTSGLNQSSCSPLNSSQSTNLTSESSHSSHSRARLNSGSPSECSSNNSNSLSALLTRDSHSRSSSRHVSPSLWECASHSKSGSNHDSRSRSRSITSSRSEHGSRHQSRSKHSSRSRSRTKHGSRDRSKSKHSSRSRSRAKHGYRDPSRSKHSSRSRSRAKHGSRDQSRSKHSSRSRSRAKHGSRDRSRSKHSSRTRSRAKHGSCDPSRSKHSSRSRSRTKHGSCSKSISTHSSHSKSKSKSIHRCRCRSGVNYGSRSKSRSKHVYDRHSCQDSSSRTFNQQASAPSRHRIQSDSTDTPTSNDQSPHVVPHTDVSASIFHSHKDQIYMKDFLLFVPEFQEIVQHYKETILEIEVKELKAIEDLNGSTRKLQQIQEELANLKQKSLKYQNMISFFENIAKTSESEKLSVPQSALSPPPSPQTPTATSEDLPIHSQPVTGFDESNNMPTLLLPQNPQTTVHRKIELNVSHGEMPRRILPSESTKKVTMKLVKPHALPPSSVSVCISTPTPTSKDLPIHSQPVTGFAESNNMPTFLLPQSTQTKVHRKIERNVSHGEMPRRILPSESTKKVTMKLVKPHALPPSSVSVSVSTPTPTSKDLPIHSQPVTGFAESNNMPTLLLTQNTQTTVHRKTERNVSHGEMPRRMLPSVSTKKVAMKLVKPHALPPSSVSVSVSTPTPTSKDLPIHSQPVTGFAESNNMPTLLLPQNTQTTVHRKTERNVSHGEMPRRMLPSASTKKVTMKLVKPHALPPSSVSVSVSTPTPTSKDLPIHSQPVTGFAESNNMPTLLLPQNTQTTVHRKTERNVSHGEMPRRMLPSVSTKKVAMTLVKPHALPTSSVSISVSTPTPTSKDLPIHSQPVTGFAEPNNMPILLLPHNTQTTVHRKIERNVSHGEMPRRMLPSASTKKVTMKLVKPHALPLSSVSASVSSPTLQTKQRVEPLRIIKLFTINNPKCQAANVAEGCISSKSRLSAKSSNPILPKSLIDVMANVVAANVGGQKKRKEPLLDTPDAQKRRAKYRLNKVLKEKSASQIDVITHDILLKDINNYKPHN